MITRNHSEIVFKQASFSPQHCQTLLRSGFNARLGFNECAFQDGGGAFLETWIEEADVRLPSHLGFKGCLPFEPIVWASFLQEQCDVSFTFADLEFGPEHFRAFT